MKNSKYSNELIVAIDAIRQSAKLTSNVLNMLDAGMLKRQDKTPVTVADFGCQALMCKELKEKFPNDLIVGEEISDSLKDPYNLDILEQVVKCVSKITKVDSSDELCDWIDRGNSNQYSNRFWSLDPIDGTKGFIRGDQYAIALALVVSGQPVAAVIGCPKFGRGIIFASTIDCGAFILPLNGNRLDGEKRIYVNREKDITKARYCESIESIHSSHTLSSKIFKSVGGAGKPTRLDSQVKYGMIASGDSEIYLRIPNPGYAEKIWDHAAGHAIVEAAGGKVSDLDGKPLDYTCGRRFENNRGVMATNGLLHSDIVKGIKKING